VIYLSLDVAISILRRMGFDKSGENIWLRSNARPS